MKSVTTSDKRKKIVAFSLILLATAVIASLLFATLWQKEDIPPIIQVENGRQVIASPARYGLLLADNAVLAARVNALQLLDARFASLLTDPNNKSKLDSVNRQISVQEEVFRGSIDSLFLNAPSRADSGQNKLFNNIVSGYRSILENRRAISSLRNALSLDKTTLKPDEIAMLKSQNELQDKTNKIAALESELKILSANKTSAATETATEMALKQNLAEQDSKIAALTATNNNLKQDNDKLLRQQTDAAKNINATEVAYKTKTTTLQQRVDELSADLRLAQVDCNLSRVDAAQIISNSKQRKQLLNEASGILTSLAKSDDAVIKKKVQDKVTQLNQVAANSRD